MIAWLLACAGGQTEAPPARSAVPPLEVDGPVWTAPVLEIPAEVPPRFTATLATPPSLATGGPERYPPVGLVQHGLCTGEGPWREQLASSVRALAAAERWRFWELTMLPWCRSPGWCEWLGRQAAPLGPVDGLPYWIGLTACGVDASAALVEASAPDHLFVQWILAHPGPFRPRLTDLATRALRDPELLPGALAALQQTDGPEATELLLVMHRRAGDPDRDIIAAHLGDRDDPRADRLHSAACAGQATAECRWERPAPLRDLARAVELGVDADALFARYPNHRSALRVGFERCVVERSHEAPWHALTCARALAQDDRALAVAALARVAGADPDLDALRRALEVPDLPGRLRELGFPITGESTGPGALDVLEAAGLTVALDGAGHWPPRHERLLYALATAAGVDDMEFDELVPSEIAPEVPGRVPRIALFAWLDGVRLRTLVDEEAADWDAARAVGLVNAALARRGAEGRFAIASGSRRAVFGPPAALEALAADGLVSWATLEVP